VSRGNDPNTGQNTIQFSGMNVQLVNGTKSTGSTPNGVGNLIIGYNELRDESNAQVKCPSDAGTERYCNRRTGSHMLVIGESNNYTSHSGIVIGHFNETAGEYSSVSGSGYNIASEKYSSVSAGNYNKASGQSNY